MFQHKGMPYIYVYELVIYGVNIYPVEIVAVKCVAKRMYKPMKNSDKNQ